VLGDRFFVHLAAELILSSPADQEVNRFGDGPQWEATNVVVSNRTLQEIYYTAFRAVVQEADPGSVMCSYNQVRTLKASHNLS